MRPTSASGSVSPGRNRVCLTLFAHASAGQAEDPVTRRTLLPGKTTETDPNTSGATIFIGTIIITSAKKEAMRDANMSTTDQVSWRRTVSFRTVVMTVKSTVNSFKLSSCDSSSAPVAAAGKMPT
ncbi:hypothetical protein J3459_015344 [Metarhizium acridum]|uniref:uncharacterized protein n=1 Tax=Metarhizium acridum TaxID=92637 RepID=UPI001C6ABBED|nr:hypothetical protein J3459_015344 [Metarhizium acridum]KAG8414009.1 hypothetical protein J3458_011663 [Metarhizium acridum]